MDPKGIALSAPEADTQMLASYGLVPVTTVVRTYGATWEIESILAQLRSRDIWAQGGAEKVVDALEASEESERQRIIQNGRADMDHRSRDAYRSYQARTGQRTRPTLVSK